MIVGADNDRSFSSEQADELRQALQENDVEHRAEIWSGLGHGWTMEDFPSFDKDGAERHWEELFRLFDSVLKK